KPTFGPPVFDRHVLALDIACVLQTLAKSAHTVHDRVRRLAVEESDYRRRPLLRARRERPHGPRAAECSQQFPPSDGDCHTPLPCEVRKGRIPRHERAVFKESRMLVAST